MPSGFHLCVRYPGVRDGEEVYVPRAQLTLAERRKNISRLLKEANGKIAHAEALSGETAELIRQGVLVEEACTS